jgi:uncharacterized protein YjeT (DUF2065 family)
METLASAFALMLVIEGVLPLLAPKAWRETFRRVMQFNDGQLRFVGLLSIGLGLVVLVLVN